MRQAQQSGTPLMRPVWYGFPAEAFEAQPTRYLLGPDLLVARVLNPGAQTTTLRLPAGASWWHAWTGEVYAGGQMVTVPSPPGRPAAFIRTTNPALLSAWRNLP